MNQKSVYGWVVPESDTHLHDYLGASFEAHGRRVYQPDHIARSVELCRRKRVAVDVGAHVGMWSYYLGMMFQRVHAFEPSPLLRECFAHNVRWPGVTLHPVALGREAGRAELNLVPDNTGASHLRGAPQGDVEVTTLDSLALPVVDLLKIDVEGFERFVMEGARETLLRCRPVVIFEEKGFGDRFGAEGRGAAAYLESLGAVQLDAVHKDVIYGWRRR